MSLGAIDFGLIVDGAVIIVENCIRRLAEAQHAARPRCSTLRERLEIVVRRDARGGPAERSSACAIIMIVYLPILTLTGVEGKMFQPMALTVILALLAALVLLASRSCRRRSRCSLRGRVAERENAARCAARSALYAPALAPALAHRAPVVAARPSLLVAAARLARARAWAASSSRASTRATSRCTRCASPAPSLDAGGRDAARARARARRSFPRSRRVFAQDRHRRDRDRPDAAERRRHLRDPEAARASGPIRASRRRELVARASRARRARARATTTSSRSRSRCASTS